MTEKRSRDVAWRLENKRIETDLGYATPCWIWSGSTTGGGYGQICVEARMRYVHLVAYELYVGPIPEKHQVDHLCLVKRCFNPDHLEPVTQLENIRRSRVRWAQFARGKCQRGHDTTDPANIYVRPGNGYRMCKECQKLRGSKQWRNS